MKKPTAVRRVFLRAIRRITRDGWCRGSYRRGRRWCLVAALGEPYDWSPESRKARGLVWKAAGGAGWNDRQKSSKPVLALLRRTAREAL